jgi:hypothetical protein
MAGGAEIVDCSGVEACRLQRFRLAGVCLVMEKMPPGGSIARIVDHQSIP